MLNTILILIITIITIIIIRKISHPSTTLKNLPPSPPTLPILGNLHQLGSHSYRSLHRLSDRHGPVMLVHFGSRPAVIISSAAAAREVMRTHDAVFSSRPKLALADRLLYENKNMSTSAYGEYWRQVRSICVLHLLSTKRVKSYRAIREEETALLVNAIANNLPNEGMNLSEMFALLTNNIVSRVVFGKKYSEDSEKKRLKGLTGELVELLGSFSVGDYIPLLSWVNRVNGFDARVDRVAKQLDEFLDGVVEEHVNGGFSKVVKGEYEKDFVDVLLEFHEVSKKDGSFSLDRDSVKALIVDMLVGGTDTISTVLEWAVSQLLTHPKVLKKLQAEVDEAALGKSSISESNLDNMPYLKAVIKETLRLCPPSPLIVPRSTMQDCKVQGFDIPAGMWVIVSAWAVGRDTNVWDNPEEFNPERFLLDSNNKNNETKSFGSIAFGAGRRACPGAAFASIVIEIVLASVVHKFDLALPDDNSLDMSELSGFTVHRKIPLYAVAKPRS